ncbi:AzlD domain-containing protein [Bacillus sp. 123MFChir2]|uniref:AzlD domain-containing protein n=1 Tax=Bacillus sp. 123MFChir2 TaxID=1169144 RepID=UPI00037EB130|nr:AzlD domain-containing protein [Bacillus sp. 123MFChir2]
MKHILPIASASVVDGLIFGIFASLTIPLVLFHEKGGSWSPEYIVAGIVAFGVGVWKRQVVFSLLTGVMTLVCWRIFVGW